MKFCSMQNCEKVAEYAPTLVLRVHEAYKNDTPLQVFFDLPICLEHKETLQVKDILTDEGWERIKGGIIVAGRAIPDRTRTEVKCVTLEEANEYWRNFKK